MRNKPVLRLDFIVGTTLMYNLFEQIIYVLTVVIFMEELDRGMCERDTYDIDRWYCKSCMGLSTAYIKHHTVGILTLILQYSDPALCMR